MKSCQTGAITTILLLNALALDLACVPVGTIVSAGADVVGEVVRLPADPIEDVVDDAVGAGVVDTVEEDVKLLDPELTLEVDDRPPPPIPITLEFVLEPEEIPELDDMLEFCEAEDDDDKDWLCDALPPVVKGILVLLIPPVGTMLFWDEPPESLPDPVPNRLEVIKDD